MLLDLHPIESLNLDFCQYGSQYYLVVVDRFSELLWANQTPNQTTAEAVKFLTAIWNIYSLRREVRCENGPTFKTTFTDTLQSLGVNVVNSSSYHPAENGWLIGVFMN